MNIWDQDMADSPFQEIPPSEWIASNEQHPANIRVICNSRLVIPDRATSRYRPHVESVNQDQTGLPRITPMHTNDGTATNVHFVSSQFVTFVTFVAVSLPNSPGTLG